MPQENTTTENIRAIVGLKHWTMAEDVAARVGFKSEEITAVVAYATISDVARDYHRREFIENGFIYDPEAERIYDLVADVLPPARKPAADLIDGFDFSGMDWGEDDDPARVRADQGGLDWPDELTVD